MSAMFMAFEQAEDPMPAARGAEQIIAASTPQPVPVAAIDDAELRRPFSLNEMKLNDCATLREDGTVLGTNCPTSSCGSAYG